MLLLPLIFSLGCSHLLVKQQESEALQLQQAELERDGLLLLNPLALQSLSKRKCQLPLLLWLLLLLAHPKPILLPLWQQRQAQLLLWPLQSDAFSFMSALTGLTGMSPS